MKYGFVRCACVSPDLVVADCITNSKNIIASAKEAASNGASIIVFPELSVTGYTCGDLFFQKALQNSAFTALEKICEETKDLNALIFTGLPFPQTEGLYNCAAAIFHGKLLALIPKTFLPNYGEFYERRQFTPYSNHEKGKFVSFASFEDIPFDTDIIIDDEKNPEIAVACELCEDLWVPVPPSSNHILAGATIIANLSAGNEIIGKADYRRNLVKSHSGRSICAYLYANAGKDESTQDMIFAGHNLIAENGSLLAESELFSGKTIYADVDVERLCQERRRTTSFACSAEKYEPEYLTIHIPLISSEEQNNEIGFTKKSNKTKTTEKLNRFVDPHPFVPSDKEKRTQRCMEVINLQAQGLAKRLRHINCKSAVIGLSGGLDSTLALLVTCRAFDLCGFDRAGITAITMPCFGTTDRTYNNACKLAVEYKTTLKEIKISDSVLQHFKDIGHDEKTHDVTYENGQARTRTLVLMDYANKTNGIVIGTGDLSELALGWCTYNGDHMSMYGVNSSVPKTLVRYLVQWFADTDNSDVLRDILDTPVSPELLPPENGKISQVTEDLVGPYELHDFYLYYLLRFGFSPAKILYLAENSNLPYERDFMLKWLKTFYRRFFSQQFKRSCLPDGAKVGTINLSPRGDWRMPSDASAAVWLKEVEELC
ncbi:MAG: NAD(+) synthase [Treponema sp.]|nr:NAD(+) synthase [Treponema sp.]